MNVSSLSRLPLFRNRLNRSGFIVGQLYIICLILSYIGLVYLLAYTIQGQPLGIFRSILQIIIMIVGFSYVLVVPAIIILEISLLVRRGHDIDTSMRDNVILWYLFYGPMLFFGKGDPDVNKYGAPRQSSSSLLVILGLKRRDK